MIGKFVQKFWTQIAADQRRQDQRKSAFICVQKILLRLVRAGLFEELQISTGPESRMAALQN